MNIQNVFLERYEEIGHLVMFYSDGILVGLGGLVFWIFWGGGRDFLFCFVFKKVLNLNFTMFMSG